MKCLGTLYFFLCAPALGLKRVSKSTVWGDRMETCDMIGCQPTCYQQLGGMFMSFVPVESILRPIAKRPWAGGIRPETPPHPEPIFHLPMWDCYVFSYIFAATRGAKSIACVTLRPGYCILKYLGTIP